jgi:predicted ribosome quality control (RQC) complex YloA/Tae2 family protein
VKTPSFLELQTIVENIQEELLEAQLQEVFTSEDGVVLGFYRFQRQPRMKYLVFDLDKAMPFLALLDDNPWSRFKKTKPIGLFLNARSKNTYFIKAKLDSKLGRVVLIELGFADNITTIEFRAISKQVNLIVSNKKNSISWLPVKQLGLHDEKFNEAESEEVRSLVYLTHQWKLRRAVFSDKKNDNIGVSPFDKWVRVRQKECQKKKKALDAVADQIKKYTTEEWSQVGEHLKTYGKKYLPPEWLQYVDPELSLAANIQNCFERAKIAKVKISGAEQRLRILQDEVLELNDLSEAKFQAVQSRHQLKSIQKKAVQRKIEGKFRKLEIADSGLTVYMGKSAADNLSLLRAAKPHDMWFHLKDYPSAHAVLHRRKDHNLSDAQIFQVAKWLILEGTAKSHMAAGGKFAVVFAECRHVKPIKGDKLGRVTYHHGREILIAI